MRRTCLNRGGGGGGGEVGWGGWGGGLPKAEASVKQEEEGQSSHMCTRAQLFLSGQLLVPPPPTDILLMLPEPFSVDSLTTLTLGSLPSQIRIASFPLLF